MSENCLRCGTAFVVISLASAVGSRELRSCSRCDIRSWSADGEPIGLDGVLADLSERPSPVSDQISAPS